MVELSHAQFPLVYAIVKEIDKHHGCALLVGGAVRDLVLNVPVKDIDIEVHDISADQLEKILQQFGPISLVGKAFGVFRLHNLNVDWSLPRIDSPGRKPTVSIDPYMSIKEAARRRDLTMNAIMLNLKTSEIIDPFGGREDIKNKILRSPDVRFFIQDPLRFYRVMQFIGRFEMLPDDELNQVCATMDISTISRERIEQEFQKLFLKSRRPSLGIRWVHTIGRLSQVLPELAETVNVPQNPQWHPEGDVFEHSMQAVDAAAHIAQQYKHTFDKLMLIYAALCHDLGKAVTTTGTGNTIKSYGHEKESEIIGKKMMKRITHHAELIAGVAVLVRNHMTPVQLVVGNAKPSAYKRLAHKVAPYATLRILADLCFADARGRNPSSHEPLINDDPEIMAFLQKSEQAQVAESIEHPIVQGRDLYDVVPPGPLMGRLVKKAYEIQIEEGIENKEELKQRIIALLKNKNDISD